MPARNQLASMVSTPSVPRILTLLLCVCLGSLALPVLLHRLECPAAQLGPRRERHSSGSDTAAARLVQELGTLGRCGMSGQGKQYRSLACAVVRNDIHLREFVVRTLLLGVCHLVISDHNQVSANTDHNTTSLLKPFVDKGLVTHHYYNADGKQKWLHMDAKMASSRKCMEQYRTMADWAMDVDSDEYLFISKAPGAAGGPRQSIGIMDEFLTAVETALPNACALHLPWRMMYGEHQVLRSPGLLLDSFRHICFNHSHKALLKTHQATYNPMQPAAMMKHRSHASWMMLTASKPSPSMISTCCITMPSRWKSTLPRVSSRSRHTTGWWQMLTMQQQAPVPTPLQPMMRPTPRQCTTSCMGSGRHKVGCQMGVR